MDKEAETGMKKGGRRIGGGMNKMKKVDMKKGRHEAGMCMKEG